MNIKDKVLNWYDSCEYAPFAVHVTQRDRVALYFGDDKETGREKLEEFLESMEYGTYTISVYESPKKIDKPFLSYKFKHEKEREYSGAGYVGTAMLVDEIRELKQTVRDLQTQIGETDSDLEDQIQPTNPILGLIGNPAVQGAISALLTRLAENMFPPAGSGTASLAGIVNETDVQDEVNRYVNVLLSKGVTVAHLKKLSEMPKVKIIGLLAML